MKLRFSTLAALGLVLAEHAAVSVLYDVQPLGLRTDAWSAVGHLGAMATFAVAAACGMFLVGLEGDVSRLRALLVSRPLDRATRGLLATHVGLFGLFWLVSARVLGPEGPPDQNIGLWMLAWAGVTALAAGTAFAAALPTGMGRPLLRGAAPLLLGGLVVGAGAWLAAEGSRRLWHPLGPWTLAGSSALLNLVTGGDVVTDPQTALLGTSAFQVHIAPECAGFEGVGLMAAFVAAMLVLGRRWLRFPAALVLIPLGLAAAWIANLVRIVLLILVGSHMSEDVAVSGFHAKAGWLMFCALALGLVALGRRVRWLQRAVPTDDGPRSSAHDSLSPPDASPTSPSGSLALERPTAAYLMPFLTLLAVAFVTGLFTTQIDRAYGLRIVAAGVTLWLFRAYYAPLLRGAGESRYGEAVGLGVAAFAVFVLLAPRPDAADAQAFQQQWADLPAWGQVGWALVKAIGSVLVIPVAEELAFRGYLLRRLLAIDFDAVPFSRLSLTAVVISSLAFGAVHGGWASGAAAGVLFAVAQWRGGSVKHAIVAHAVANLAVVIYAVGFGGWWIWM